ncbi:murein biosynthesis integral membrane protein MurJ [Campylobacter sp. VBCF_06 NA8]|uniref:murein biosynthesis integral membrane protein MurJ n=1 Tax=Campylobacter sp. VBCF_06 NA8 TaxID=2983822 RepID=UPI003FA4C6D7
MFRGFFTNSVGTLASRILGFVRDLLTASILGAGVYSDIFFVAFKLPNLFRRLFGEGAFTQAFLPNFTASKKKGIFAASVLIRFFLFILFLTAVVWVFAPFFTKILAYGFSDEQITLATPFVRINFIYLAFIFIVTLFASMLQYRDHFATTAFSTALLNLAMIAALLLARGKDERSIVLYLSCGVVAGGFLQFLVHVYALKFTGMLRVLLGGFARLKNGAKAQTKGFYNNFFAGVVGASALQLSSFIDTFFASFLASGSISYLYYANRIFQLPLALFAIALSTAIFPRLTKQIKTNNQKEALNLIERGFYMLLALLALSTIGGIMLSHEITKILFERGNFTATNTAQCAAVLAAYMVGLLPFGLSRIFSHWLYAHMKQKLSAKISLWCVFINVILCAIFFKPFGAVGLALASSITGGFLFVFNLYFFGFNNFLAIIKAKKILLILGLCALEIGILYVLKGLYYGNL